MRRGLAMPRPARANASKENVPGSGTPLGGSPLAARPGEGVRSSVRAAVHVTPAVAMLSARLVEAKRP